MDNSNRGKIGAIAIGDGVLVGLGLGIAYLVDCMNGLNRKYKTLNQKLTKLEEEICLDQKRQNIRDDISQSTRRTSKKAVSFSSSKSYRTARERHSSGNSYRTAWDTEGSVQYDTEYFSPDEDEEEFFDIPHEDDMGSYVNYEISSDSCEAVTECVNLLRRVDTLLDDGMLNQQVEAFNLMERKADKYKYNSEVLWRRARVGHDMAMLKKKEGNLDYSQELLDQALGYAKEALKLNEHSAEVHKWYAIIAGARGQNLSIGEKIESGNIFKKHIDLALQISPNDGTLHHLLGRFCYEVSMITWFERRAAAALYGEIHYTTFEEALRHFIMAEDLLPYPWMSNRFSIAKCYFQMNNMPEVRSWLRKALDLAIITVDDELSHQEAQEFMETNSIAL